MPLSAFGSVQLDRSSTVVHHAPVNIHVDTLDYANALQSAGIERAHAEAIAKLQARTMRDLVENELVTKDFLRSELAQLETKLRDEIRGSMTAVRGELRDEIRGDTTTLREEMRGSAATLREEMRGDTATLQEEMRGGAATLREEIRQQAVSTRLQIDALMVQIRSLQLGGAIAAFSIGAIVLMARLIR
jgi:hypothetical protein